MDFGFRQNDLPTTIEGPWVRALLIQLRIHRTGSVEQPGDGQHAGLGGVGSSFKGRGIGTGILARTSR